jgi:hypothetical protein
VSDTKFLGAQVDPDSELWQQFEEYKDGEVSKSEAVRGLVRAGLEREGYLDRPADQQTTENPLAAAVWSQARATFTMSLLSLSLMIALTLTRPRSRGGRDRVGLGGDREDLRRPRLGTEPASGGARDRRRPAGRQRAR